MSLGRHGIRKEKVAAVGGAAAEIEDDKCEDVAKVVKCLLEAKVVKCLLEGIRMMESVDHQNIERLLVKQDIAEEEKIVDVAAEERVEEVKLYPFEFKKNDLHVEMNEVMSIEELVNAE
ncbi:hypothetical protein SUGI_0213360 [Cryptomeria japonica]|nr:hypothetical protein SUGI_0213360 [Cryptomeria japonica]